MRHIIRDPRSLVIAILMPIMMTLLYGYAINLDIKNIRLAVLDFDRTSASRELANKFFNSGYFRVPGASADLMDPERILQSGRADAILIIGPGLAKALEKGESFELGLTIDGADANYAAAAASYSQIVLGSFLKEHAGALGRAPGIALSQRVLYNPDLKSSHFFVPGLIAIILMMISALLTSVTIAREKETGTMEQLLTTPVTPLQVIIGKVLPYSALALLDGTLIILFAVLHFGVPFSGSVALLFAFGVVYVIAALSIGVLISTIVNTQQVAMMAAMMATVLPSVMLSGFIFDIDTMPAVLQCVTYIVPAKYFLLIIRGIMLKGSGVGVLAIQAVFLTALAAVLLGTASKRFKLKIG
ncbi:MAG: ABC transporter permease [Chitinivibrionia bacterium]|nr:ABC transporter permease [Chitinivibrionia bacterium]